MQVQAYVDDELIYHGGCKAKWATASIAAIAELREQIKKIQLPLLLIHGIDDKLVPISGSEFIASNVSSPHLRFEVNLAMLLPVCHMIYMYSASSKE